MERIMKAQRLIMPVVLFVFVCIGAISYPLLPSIEAALVPPFAPRHAVKASFTLPEQHTTPFPTPGKPVPVPTDRAVGITPVPTRIAPRTVALDTFQRPDQFLWGTASDGLLWGADANKRAAFEIIGDSGRIVNGQGAYNAILGPSVTNAEILFTGKLSSFQQNNLGAVLRWQDDFDWYKAYIDGTQLLLVKDVAGMETLLNAVSFAASANTLYTLRFAIEGSQLFARAWLAGQTEPSTWMIQATDTSIVSGSGGLRLVVTNGAQAAITIFMETP
jgi:hypothetical protein